jgi:hypothetical protein
MINDTTMMVVDTIKSVDTLIVYIGGKSKLELEYYSYLSSFYSKNRYDIKSLENANLNQKLNTEVSGWFGWQTGAGFSLHYNSNFFSSGLNLMCQRERIAHQPSNILISQINYQKLDTIAIWGQVIGGDTNWIAEIEKNTYTTYDTLKIAENYINSYYYLQIPLMLGKNYSWSNAEIRLSAGIINQFRIANSTIVFVNEEDKLYKVNQDDLRIFKLSYCATINVDYMIYEKLFLSSGLSYIGTRHPVKQSFGLTKFHYLSIAIGLRYTW